MGQGMHPGMMAWWKRRAADRACGGLPAAAHPGGGGEGGCGPRYAAPPGEGEGELGGGVFGVRRPLRFLALRLELDDLQVAELARVLDDLKTERAQVAVDHRRTTSAFADAIADDTFDAAKVAAAAEARVRSAERLRDALTTALTKIHALLRPEQRQKLAYLIRTGTILL